ncbi:transposase [Lysinibacillus mangiferihumi]|uniref:transposase n=1 Tax=Lysinibacillus mangiferihumi TaxID=1130819 RepID=UPI00142DD453
MPRTISAEKITQLYRIRWQIELRFKTWKSHLKLHQIKDMKVERWLCHIYSQCIVMLLSMMTTGYLRKIV